jgi:site-specific DNA-methyltransferase (adenine-specific)
VEYIVKLNDLPPKLDSLDLILDKIVEGDCLELMKRMPDGCVDAVITDPPYGVGIEYSGEYEDTQENWRLLMKALVPQARRVAKFAVFPSCRILELPWIYANAKPDWLICWAKGSPGTLAHVGFNDWEPHVVYGKPPAPIHDYFLVSATPHDNGHPCPKPLGWALWLVERAARPDGIIFDPFLGSGTTAVAAKKLARHFIGCEISPEYCRIAERRLQEIDSQPNLFEADTKTEQLKL